MASSSRAPTDGVSRRGFIAGGMFAASVALVPELLTAPAAQAAELIRYQFPFPNPNLDDGFGSTKPPRTRPHRGLDFPQPRGAAIPAVATGVLVLKAGGPDHELGYYTVLAHADGKFSGYCHSNQPSWWSVGETVERGQAFALVGDLGFSTGPHLHLTLGNDLNGAVAGHVQDPYPYIKERLNVPEPPPPDEDEDNDVIRIILDPTTGAQWLVNSATGKRVQIGSAQQSILVRRYLSKPTYMPDGSLSADYPQLLLSELDIVLALISATR